MIVTVTGFMHFGSDNATMMQVSMDRVSEARKLSELSDLWSARAAQPRFSYLLLRARQTGSIFAQLPKTKLVLKNRNSFVVSL